MIGAPSGPVVVSVLSLALLAVAIAVAWWTRDPSLPILLGVVGANAGTTVNFWLGSSAGSRAKDERKSTQGTTP